MENIKLAKRLNILAGVVTIVVLLLVGMMRRPQFKIATDIDFSFLPPFHATLNALVAVVLLFALYFIKNKNVEAHKKSIYTAMVLSAMFLLSYVVYHFTTEETKYCFEGASRNIYFFFLITHVVLAAVILPFILLTFIRAYTGQIEKHRKMAKWVWPFWFYVAVTGPICYLMLRPCY
jgi:putative membrane protein